MTTRPNRPRVRGRVTGSQVAALAKVDAAVVSKILKEDPTLRISPETRKRVMDAIEELGYRPNYAAQRLRSSRKIGAVGLIIPNFSNPAYAEIVHGAEVASLKKKVALFVCVFVNMRKGDVFVLVTDGTHTHDEDYLLSLSFSLSHTLSFSLFRLFILRLSLLPFLSLPLSLSVSLTLSHFPSLFLT